MTKDPDEVIDVLIEYSEKMTVTRTVQMTRAEAEALGQRVINEPPGLVALLKQYICDTYLLQYDSNGDPLSTTTRTQPRVAITADF